MFVELIWKGPKVGVWAEFGDGPVMVEFQVVYVPDRFPQVFIVHARSIFKIAAFATIIHAELHAVSQLASQSKRCRSYEAGCANCDTWRFYDERGRFCYNFEELQGFMDLTEKESKHD